MLPLGTWASTWTETVLVRVFCSGVLVLRKETTLRALTVLFGFLLGIFVLFFGGGDWVCVRCVVLDVGWALSIGQDRGDQSQHPPHPQTRTHTPPSHAKRNALTHHQRPQGQPQHPIHTHTQEYTHTHIYIYKYI
jgi:hypothetical protein